MHVPIACESCDASFEADAARVRPGEQIPCPKCKGRMVVPPYIPGPGFTLGGEYKIRNVLGEGAMGKVFLATQLSMKRDVALKILPVDVATDEEMVLRFEQEMRMAASVQHPNLIMAYGAGDDHDIYYLAIEFVDGMSLEDYLNHYGAVAEKEALTVVRKIVQALEVAWSEQRMLHRDIKPDNIMVTQEGEPKLADLGLAKSLHDNVKLTMTNLVVGTPNYMSLEHRTGDPAIDFRTDFYSLGATLYHLLTNQVPYDAPTIAQTLALQSQEALQDPRAHAPELSIGCVDLLESMLAEHMDHRHASHQALIDDIDRVLEDERPAHPRPEAGASAMGREASLDGPASKEPRSGLFTKFRSKS